MFVNDYIFRLEQAGLPLNAEDEGDEVGLSQLSLAAYYLSYEGGNQIGHKGCK